jgi:hypothetical protein
LEISAKFGTPAMRMKSARGLAQSKTLARWRWLPNFAKGFGASGNSDI